MFREHKTDLLYSDGSPVAGAVEVRLQVVAPHAYYARCNLKWLEEALDGALPALLKHVKVGAPLKMRFFFLSLPLTTMPFATSEEMERMFKDAARMKSFLGAFDSLKSPWAR